MSIFDLTKLDAAPLAREPFEYVIVPGFVRGSELAALNKDFPKIGRPGSIPPSELDYGPKFQAMLDEFAGSDVRAAFARKFDVDLSGRPLMSTASRMTRLIIPPIFFSTK